MTRKTPPVLSVIVRRFHQDHADDIETSIRSIQQASADQPGFIGLQNSITPKRDDCELVTVISFDTQDNLDRWETSALRKAFVTELDRLSLDDATNSRFQDLRLLAHPAARISKAETVVILIGWILLLGTALRYPVDLLLPEGTGPFWRSVLMTTLIVPLISYVLLPWSSIVLTRLKTRLDRE